MLERVAVEFNQLQFHAVQSKGLPLLDRVRPVSAGRGGPPGGGLAGAWRALGAN